MEFDKPNWGQSRTTYDFICPCGYVVIKDEKKAKERMERLHLSKCEAGRAAKAAGHCVNYLNDAVFSQSGLKSITGDSTDGGRPIVAPQSILNNQLK
jgi:hypothetical protein